MPRFMPGSRRGDLVIPVNFWMQGLAQNDRDVLHRYRIACRFKGSRLVRNGVDMSIDDARLSSKGGMNSEFSRFCREMLREDLQLIVRYNAIHGRTSTDGEMQIHPQDNQNTHQLTRDLRTNDYQVALKCQWRKALMKGVLSNEMLRREVHKWLNGKLRYESRERANAAAATYAAEQSRERMLQREAAQIASRRAANRAEQFRRYGV